MKVRSDEGHRAMSTSSAHRTIQKVALSPSKPRTYMVHCEISQVTASNEHI